MFETMLSGDDYPRSTSSTCRATTGTGLWHGLEVSQTYTYVEESFVLAGFYIIEHTMWVAGEHTYDWSGLLSSANLNSITAHVERVRLMQDCLFHTRVASINENLEQAS